MNDAEVDEHLEIDTIYVEINTLKGYVFLAPSPEHLKLLEEERRTAGLGDVGIQLFELDAAGDETRFRAAWCDGSRSRGYRMVLNPKKIYAARGDMRKAIRHECGHIKFRHPDRLRFLGKLHPKLAQLFYQRIAEPRAVVYEESTR